MRTAMRLREYEAFISIEEIYSLIALTAFYARFYGQCSKAFIKLQARAARRPAATRHAPRATRHTQDYTQTPPLPAQNCTSLPEAKTVEINKLALSVFTKCTPHNTRPSP